MSIIRGEPFGELERVRRVMDRIFDEVLPRPSRWLETPEAPPLDIYQTDNEVVVKAALPGLKPEDVEITITGDTLTIKGEAKEEQEVKRESYFLKERRYGAVSRTVGLPSGLVTDKAEATFDNGVLTLTIPKAEEVKPKTIKIKAREILEGQR